jgi:hypothetical protein
MNWIRVHFYEFLLIACAVIFVAIMLSRPLAESVEKLLRHPTPFPTQREP